MEFRASHNLLVVSDLHLGADLKRTGFAYLRGVATLDREFGAFLDWYASHPDEGLPWRLIINGDMVDFINVTMLPSDEEARAAGFAISEAERLYGLSGEEAKIAWMMGRIVDRHRKLFEKLARFVSNGNEVAILRGNHDVEFCWPLVQERFRELLVGIAGVSGAEREVFLGRIAFLPWFYYEPGTIFVEHGNQYDDYSSFEHVLAPVAPSRPAEVDLPLSHFAIRYLANAFQNISTDDKDGWKLMDYFRFAASGKAGSVAGLVRGYLGMLVHVARAFFHRWRISGRVAMREHSGAIARLAAEWHLPEEVLAKLARLHRGDALRSVWRTAQCFYVDRFALVGGGLLLAFFFLADFRLSSFAFLLAFVCLLAIVAGDRVLARARSAEIPPKRARAGHAIAALVGVPLVVMGHSHHACEVRDASASEVRYVNTGTWIPPAGDAAAGFTHLRVRRQPAAATADGGKVQLDAELRRWNPRAAGPERL